MVTRQLEQLARRLKTLESEYLRRAKTGGDRDWVQGELANLVFHRSAFESMGLVISTLPQGYLDVDSDLYEASTKARMQIERLEVLLRSLDEKNLAVPPTWLTSLGPLFKALREFQGMTQGELAHLLNMDQGSVSNLEHGNRQFSVGRVADFAANLGLQPVLLLIDEDTWSETIELLIDAGLAEPSARNWQQHEPLPF